MTDIAMGGRCATHPDRLAVSRCDRCARPLCGECRLEAVAAERVFCSPACREAAAAEPGRASAVADDALLAGLAHPIRVGWQLWRRSLGGVLLYNAPLALLSGSVAWLDAAAARDAPSPLIGAFDTVLVAYGVALTGVLLSHHHTGRLGQNPYVAALRGLGRWLGTWLLVALLVLPGLLLFVLPGLAVWLRLFWADELALVHGLSPVRALGESWRLTRGLGVELFFFQLAAGMAQWLFLLPALLLLGMIGVWLATSALPLDVSDGLFTAAWFWVISGTYAAMHAPEIAFFYGLRASRARARGGGA
jgi:hypothetical protein